MVHVLVVTFAGQGHINPFLRLAKRLASKGLLVTFATLESMAEKMRKASCTEADLPIDAPTAVGQGLLRFEFISDGWSEGLHGRQGPEASMAQLQKMGPQGLASLIDRQAEAGRPVSFAVTNPFMPWALDAAASAGIKCAVFWVQSCAAFSIYYHHFHSKSTAGFALPIGLPTLSADEMPTFLLPSNPYAVFGEAILGQFKNLSRASCVLVDSFEELERPVIEGMSRVYPITPIGPLFVSNDDGSVENKIRGDLWKAEDCVEWLDSHPPSSVVYISFGSIVALERDQMEEMAGGVGKSGRPFLWVVRPATDAVETGLPEGFLEDTEGRGKVVSWCPQDRVLSHPSIACFLTHCGWNSSLESLSCGVPIIAFPQWGDQVTNAKFMVEVFKVGVRLTASGDGGNSKLVRKEEVERCISLMTTNRGAGAGAGAEEMRKNALKWKEAARAAVAHGGSSHRNIQAFVDDVNGGNNKILASN
ncbi:hypothetical protein ACLOJK_000868 [Asimina triloba]